ncbi:acyl carrier protein 3, mitochondrial [Senna tora]|uniref:Acyl carrier protein n=1 Tax=Senna tora TaxID=362788 RepID=A0A834X9E7_9FABA|nr:acyl carrier protein 3, mitochondrial [Senna tora]
MHSIRKSILRHMNLRRSTERWFASDVNVLMQSRCLCSLTSASFDHILPQVIGMVKNYNRIDASKVTKTADFQKDLNLDSLDRAELIMHFEAEFSIEIPEEKAEKLTCCADVANYIATESDKRLIG